MSRPVNPLQVAEFCIASGFSMAVIFYASSLLSQAMGSLPITPLENLFYLPAGFAIGFFGYPIFLKIHFWRQDKNE